MSDLIGSLIDLIEGWTWAQRIWAGIAFEAVLFLLFVVLTHSQVHVQVCVEVEEYTFFAQTRCAERIAEGRTYIPY